jgi:hypothetical protein
MGKIADRFAQKRKEDRAIADRLAQQPKDRTDMTPFERDKRRRNIVAHYYEDKGLRDGRCNRQACQQPLAVWRHRASMRDHETNTNERLYYCPPCAQQFDAADDEMRQPRRITYEDKKYG